MSHVLFPAGAVLGLALFVLALGALSGDPEVAVLPIGLPALPFHLLYHLYNGFSFIAGITHFYWTRLLHKGAHNAPAEAEGGDLRPK